MVPHWDQIFSLGPRGSDHFFLLDCQCLNFIGKVVTFLLKIHHILLIILAVVDVIATSFLPFFQFFIWQKCDIGLQKAQNL